MHPILDRLLHPGIVWVLIPITWLVVTGVVEVIQSVQRHSERIAMIEQGIHPDSAPGDETVDDAIGVVTLSYL